MLEVVPMGVQHSGSTQKKKDKIRVCMDFVDLNRASSKDNFPLPHIDMLVDNVAYSFSLLNLEGERIMSKYWRNCLKD